MGPAGCIFLLPLLLGISDANEEEPENLLKLSKRAEPGWHWVDQVTGICAKLKRTPVFCGRPAVSSGIASGREANVGQWPWQVSIRQGLLHICAATLISKQWVLTIASCFRSKDTRKYNVLVGSLQVSGRRGSKMTIIPVSRIIPYPHFQGNTTSTIAVAKLAYPVSFTPVVLPICLPSSAVQLKNSTSCWVTGWGHSGTHQHMKPSYILKEIEVLLIDLQTCSDYYQKANLHGIKPIFNEATICSKLPVGEMDQCIGSRGDPLTCRVEDFWVLAGVVSWESNCIQTNEPGIYTNISFYRSWIEKSAISHTDFSVVVSLDFSSLLPIMLLPLIFLGLP